MTKFPNNLEEINNLSREDAVNFNPQDLYESALNRSSNVEELRNAFDKKYAELFPEVAALIEKFEYLRDVEKLSSDDIKFKIIVDQLAKISKFSVVFAFWKVTPNSEQMTFAHTSFVWAVVKAFGYPDCPQSTGIPSDVI